MHKPYPRPQIASSDVFKKTMRSSASMYSLSLTLGNVLQIIFSLVVFCTRQGVLPISTALSVIAFLEKLYPLIVITVPPKADPLLGLKEVMLPTA